MVVDDHPMWRTGVARDLAEAGYDVAAAVGEGAQAVRVAAAVRPDVVVLDLQLPDRSGVEVIRGRKRGNIPSRESTSSTRSRSSGGLPSATIDAPTWTWIGPRSASREDMSEAESRSLTRSSGRLRGP